MHKQKDNKNLNANKSLNKAPISKKQKEVVYDSEFTIGDYAKAMNITPATIIKKCIELGVMANVNQILDKETLMIICEFLGYTLKEDKIDELSKYDEFEQDSELDKNLKKRQPIVTIMGHVDHGKTTLLDTIRATKVVLKEAGGITQHIGAYQVRRPNGNITFIDTPGHAAFSEMRARGAKVTDIVILVVAADDGVKPQTIEAIDHALAANVKIIVAINKIDKPTANPDRVLQELANHNILTESWGGDIPVCEISALKNQGIDELLDMIDLVAEMQELKANPDKFATGTVIESRLDKGRGVVTTLIVLNGTLKKGDIIVVGNCFGKVRTLSDELGRMVKKALPGEPVEMTGLQEQPKAGDKFMIFEDEKTAKQVAEKRQNKEREKNLLSKTKTFDELLSDTTDENKILKLIIKGDVSGSIEALTGLLNKIEVEDLKIQILAARVGQITENDLILAQSSQAILIGFNVRPTSAIRQMAEEKGVEIKLYNIIYKLQEDIELALKGMLEPETKEIIIGQAEVREVFKVGKINIAGCFVTDGSVKRDSLVRIIRDGIVIYTGQIESLKRFKDDAKEVQKGYDCGIKIAKYDDVKVGDIIEASEIKEVNEE